MKKLIFIFFIGFMIVSNAEASAIIITPNVITTAVGKTFTLPVKIDPSGVRQYTARLSIAFPPDLLEISSFTFDKNWLSVPQPSYDNLDNKIGELIKTAGFPKGFSSQVPFGTITFRAKKTGESTIIVGSQSFVLNAQNNNTLVSRPQIMVTASLANVSVPEAPSITPASPIQPSPNLPQTGKIIFDVSSLLKQKEIRFGMVFFLILLVVAIFEIIRRIFHIKRRK